VQSATKIACGLLSAKYKLISLAAGSGCVRISTDERIMLSGVQLLIFAVVYAVWGPHDLEERGFSVHSGTRVLDFVMM
jgi:hypothetical protein